MLVGNRPSPRLQAHQVTSDAPGAVVADGAPGDLRLKRPLKVVGQKIRRVRGNDLAIGSLGRHLQISVGCLAACYIPRLSGSLG